MSTEKIRLIVVSFTVMIMLATLAIGYSAYITSRESALANVYETNLDLARAFRDYSTIKLLGTNMKAVLDGLRTTWNSMDRSMKGGFFVLSMMQES